MPKVTLTVARVTREDGKIVVQQAGDEITVNAATAERMIAKGQAEAAAAPVRKTRRKSAKK